MYPYFFYSSNKVNNKFLQIIYQNLFLKNYFINIIQMLFHSYILSKILYLQVYLYVFLQIIF